MGNLIIKGKGGAGNKLILQDQAGAAVLTTADSGATIANVASIQLTPGSAPTATEGAVYYNSTTKIVYVYNGTAWKPFSISSTGGVITSYTSGGTTYMVHTFTYSDTFTPIVSTTVDYLVVGGGGGGATSYGGAGGAGGFRTATGLAVTAQAYTITVGNGGAGGTQASAVGVVGSNSSALGITALGGGYGTNSGSGGSGGSGGGACGTGGGGQNYAHGNGGTSSAYGNNGGTGWASGSNPGGGGGGGAGGAGQNAALGDGGNGGVGSKIVIGLSAANSTLLLATANAGVVESADSNHRYLAGGGGGSGYQSGMQNSGTGGLGGGTHGTGNAQGDVDDAVANTGSGGGGNGAINTGGNGGSGIVIIRYAI